MAEPALWVEWQATSGPGGMVMPDGCRDLILSAGTGAFVTDFDHAPRQAGLPAGLKLHGFRLRPGVVLPEGAQPPTECDATSARRFLHDHAAPDPATAPLIAALGAGESGGGLLGLRPAARRSLQRRFQRRGLPPPRFWQGLARARRAAMELSGPLPLAEIALIYGYSDQAHLTRDCHRWFGAPPARLRDAPGLLRLLAQPGLGNWTGEQISIR